ncbi:MAG: hypothetical protein COB97_02620 [Paracoccus sp.]|nr:MAG: hypothetical protein COB97_02620 [Paracoccus sp. (in: a-proteobacteria)]
MQAVEVEHYRARPQYCETDKTIGFRFKSGFACYREWCPRQENDVRRVQFDVDRTSWDLAQIVTGDPVERGTSPLSEQLELPGLARDFPTELAGPRLR